MHACAVQIVLSSAWQKRTEAGLDEKSGANHMIMYRNVAS